MEKRLILAIFLSFLVLFLYQLIFIKPHRPAESLPPETAVVEKSVSAESELPEEQAPAGEKEKVEPALSGQEIAAAEEQTITVETPLYRAVWSNRGGVLISWQLKNHLKKLPDRKNSSREPLDLVPENASRTGLYPLALKLKDENLMEKANRSLYRVEGDSVQLGPDGSASLVFEYSDGNNIKIRKEFTFNGREYNLGIKVELLVAGREEEPVLLWGPGIGSPSPEELKERFSADRGAAFFSSREGKVFRLQEKKIAPEKEAGQYAGLGWASYEENYFVAIFLLEKAQGQAFAFKQEIREQQPDGKTTVVPYFYLAVSRPREAYIGPKEYSRLKAFGHGTTKIINFGFFGGIAELLLLATRYVYRAIPNWGVAIIIVTLIIKILFFPLTYSSTKSMARMAELQPKIKAIRAKYKKAKQDLEQRRQMNEELMRLYKEHGINPASGCLPLLIQVPIFVGFYRMLVVAVEFRHSPFIFWIKDLSVRDPYYVTPILMGVTQFISQKMTPSTADPAQQKMMLLMPFVFTILFMNFQAGLVLYWLTNNVLQIAQQAIMNRMMARKRESDGKRRKK